MHLMTSCVKNIHTSNYQNLIISFYVTVETVGDVFLGHSVVYIIRVCRTLQYVHCLLSTAIDIACCCSMTLTIVVLNSYV